MRIVSLSSGSRGNAALFMSEKTAVLIDCGIGIKYLTGSLRSLGLDPAKLSGVVVTHEHSDHVLGLKMLMKTYDIPVYGTVGTLTALKDEYFSLEGRKLMESVRPGRAFKIGDMEFMPFRIFHDAAFPVMYRVGDGKSEAGILTDCGHPDESYIDALTGLDALVLEANHDVGMLMQGRYPAFLKRRILSPVGHLSNEESGRLLAKVSGPRLKAVILAHLSEANNTPDAALSAVRAGLMRANGRADADIFVAMQGRVSRLIEL